MDNRIKEILPLTSLRFVTALYVFLFHIEIYWHLIPHGRFARFLMKGASGMSMFFILSGFVLGYRFFNGVNNYKNYAFNRFTRIYPAYFFAALVTLPWLIYSLATYDSVALRYSFIILLNILMLQAWTPQFFTMWNIGGSWSLSVEMFFYALFPFLINHIKSLSNKQLYVALLLLYSMTSLPGISWVLFIDKNIDPLIFYSLPIFRVSEFIIGLICGLLFAKGFRMVWPNLCTILSAALLYTYLARGPNWGFVAIAHNFATVPLIGLLLFSTASLSSGWLYRFMTNSLFLYLGRISYSFYSFQALVLMTLLTKHDSIVNMFPAMSNVYVLCVVSFLALLAIASVSYYLLENKFRNYLNRKFDKKTITVQRNMVSA
ncbi:MAG: acyltransferase [Legionella sp.]|uniref:acyltransferase family protein n=1 Tax=Legionella sp. TaxID=459 RepID=UPI002845D07A|nr:acyltransferase [Legionella sp.]